MSIPQQIGKKIFRNFIQEPALPISSFAFLFVWKSGGRRSMIQNFCPVFANRLEVFRRQFVRNFFRLYLERQVEKFAEEIFGVEVRGNYLRHRHQHGEFILVGFVDGKTNQRVIFKVDFATNIRFKNLCEFLVELVLPDACQIAENNFGLKKIRRVNDFDGTRAQIAEIGAEIFIVAEHPIDGYGKSHRVDGSAHFVQRLNEKVRRHEIFAREKFFLLRGQLFNRFKLARVVAERACHLPPVNALQNIFLIVSQLQSVHLHFSHA